MPTLDRIAIEGFKSIRCLDLRLGRINVLIGPNGSGKSNVFGAMALLRATLRDDHELDDHVARSGGADKILHFGAKITERINFEIACGATLDVYRQELFAGTGDRLVARRPPVAGNEDRKLRQSRRRMIRQFRCYHFRDTGPSAAMKKTADLNDNRHLKTDGSNIAAVLYLLRRKHPDTYSMIRRTVRLAAPFFDDFQLESLAPNEDTIRLEWRHRSWDACFDASSFSDGTLRFIALATLLLMPVVLRPPVIFIDKPELDLHPCAVALLASLVKQASVGDPGHSRHTVTPVARSLRPGRRARGRSGERGDRADKVGSGETGGLAGRVQPRAALGEKRVRRPAHPRGMTQLLVHGEGQTEESFFNEVFAPHVHGCGFSSIGAWLMGKPRQRDHRGDVRGWPSGRPHSAGTSVVRSVYAVSQARRTPLA